MLGVQAIEAPLTQGITLYWDSQRERRGYFTDIHWNSSGGIESVWGIWGTPSDEQAGLSLDSIHARDPNGWYYAKEPVPLIQFGCCIGIAHQFGQVLEGQLGHDFLSKFIVKPELHGRPVYVCFSSIDDICAHKKIWNDAILNAVDALLAKQLAGDDSTFQLKERMRWLPYLFGSVSDGEQFHLRKLLMEHPDLGVESIEQLVSDMSNGNKFGYKLINVDQSLRFDQQLGLVVPEDRIFASVDNARKAGLALRDRLMNRR